MSERRDDPQTTEPDARPAREPGSYYYDDATGYEVYSPEEDAEQDADEATPPEPGGA